MDDRTEPNNCTGTNWYGGTRFWYDIIWFGSWYEVIWFGSWFVILVRNFGTMLFGSVRGTKFWYESQWFGSCSDSWFVISVPVRNGSVRFVFFKRLFFSNRTVYEPTYLVRNRFGPIFRKNIFIFANQLRTGQITYQINWFVIGSVKKTVF